MRNLWLCLLVALSGCTTVIQQPSVPAEPSPTSAPTIAAFTVTPNVVALGASVQFDWSVDGQADSLYLQYPSGKRDEVSGRRWTIFPNEAGVYTLEVSNEIGSDSATATLTLQ